MMSTAIGHAGRRLALSLAVVVAASAAAGGSASARTAGAVVRYTSQTNGYSLLLPTGWVRLRGVRWTPAGPPADLTIMTPDRQAALGIMVTPTGRTTYSRAELQGIALRLLYQEDNVLSSTSVQTKRLVINGVPYETASAYLVSGLPTMATFLSIGVAQRNHRLFAVAGLVYIQLYTLQQGGPSEPTATPDGGFGQPIRAGARPLAVAAPTAVVAPVVAAPAARPWHRPADAPAPPPTSQWRGNRCPSGDDAGLAIADRNCAWRAENAVLQAVASTLTLSVRAPADRLPAATVGVDGFVRYADRAHGYAVSYPAQWAPISVPGTSGAVRSPDQNAAATVGVQSINASSLAQSDLQSVAAAQIAQVGSALGNISYRTTSVNGILYLVAFAPGVGISTANGGLGQAQVGVVVAAYRHRLYSVRGVALTVSSTDATPVLYPYFSPFTPFARGYQNVTDTHGQEAGLALQTALSLVVDPNAGG